MDEDYSGEVRKMTELLTLARVAVYPVDARGLVNLPSTTAELNIINPNLLNSTPGAPGQGTVAQRIEQTNHDFLVTNWAEHAAMAEIAQQTGGAPPIVNNAVGEALEQDIANGSDYYTLGYAPENQNYDGQYRPIQVAVNGRHDALEYRRGYFAADPLKPEQLIPGRTNAMVNAMQHGSLPLSQVNFDVRVLPAGDPVLDGEKPSDEHTVLALPGKKQPSHYMIDYWIDPRALEEKPAANAQQERDLEITQVVYNDEGIRENSTDAPVAVTLSAPEVEAAMRDGIRLHEEIDVPAGHNYLRIGVRDVLSGRIGTVEVPVDGPGER
jgi:hypothetical protein